MDLIIINGPNLNLLGRREPSVYGSQSFDDFFSSLKLKYPLLNLSYFQSNHEGEIIDKLHEKGGVQTSLGARFSIIRMG